MRMVSLRGLFFLESDAADELRSGTVWRVVRQDWDYFVRRPEEMAPSGCFPREHHHILIPGNAEASTFFCAVVELTAIPSDDLVGGRILLSKY
jgi:hypothetical protein